ncbi:hypothetical protein FJZ40_00480 [Candidatus Shapirobacteria bacterium]|nr:hypothetical protein [Candidatus Shapirobacteria bacterium]
MTKISRLRVDPEKMSLFLDDFWSAVASLESKEEARGFFNEFLSHTERKMFAKRFQVVIMLLAGYDYSSIKSRLRVSEGTISKISNWLEENRESLLKVAQRILSLKRKRAEELTGESRSRVFGGDLLSPIVGEIANSAARSLAKRRKRLSLSTSLR